MLYRLINLDRHPERLAAFQAAHALLPIERHRGIDGDAVDRPRLIGHNVISPDLDYTNEALGRALSHMVQWRDAIKADSAMTVIEDTVVLAPNFCEEVERVISGLPADWEFIAWGQDSVSVLFEVSTGVLSRVTTDASASNAAFVTGFGDRLVTAKPFRMYAGTGAIAYSISVRGAWRLQDALLPLRPMTVKDLARDQTLSNTGLDVMLARAWPMISAWVSFPPLAAIRAGEVAREAPTGVAGVTSRRSVVSYDLFDTLVARRCVEPQGIFRIMARHLQVPNFPKARIEAERLLMHGEFDLEDIYRNVGTILGLSADDTHAMMDLEIQTELDNMIPIQQVVSMVRPQDIVVSDMYLGIGILRKILHEKLGLIHNQLFVSCHGKKNGVVWPALLGEYEIDLHVGDNPVTDLHSPGAFNIPAQLTDLSPLSVFERLVDDAGMHELARAMREARLTAICKDRNERGLKEAQSQGNLPFLFVTGLHLVEQVRVHGYQRLLLSGRDCHKLSLLLPEMLRRAGLDCDVVYFHSSRLLRCQATPAYIQYFNSLRHGRPTLVVDLCGSGRSLQRLLAVAGNEDEQTAIYIAHYRPEVAAGTHYEHLVAGKQPKVTAMITGGTYNQDCLELLNTAEHPMVEGMSVVAGQMVPVYFDAGYGREARDIVAMQHSEFARCVKILFAHHDPSMAYSGNQTLEVAKAIYAGIGNFWIKALQSLIDKHFHDNAIVIRRLRDLGQARLEHCEAFEIVQEAAATC